MYPRMYRVMRHTRKTLPQHANSTSISGGQSSTVTFLWNLRPFLTTFHYPEAFLIHTCLWSYHQTRNKYINTWVRLLIMHHRWGLGYVILQRDAGSMAQERRTHTRTHSTVSREALKAAVNACARCVVFVCLYNASLHILWHNFIIDSLTSIFFIHAVLAVSTFF